MDKPDYDIEIEEEFKNVRTLPEKEGVVRRMYSQKALLNVDKKNDIEFSIPMMETQPPFKKGLYKFRNRNCLFGVNQYGNLQIKAEYSFGNDMFPIVELVPVTKEEQASRAIPPRQTATS